MSDLKEPELCGAEFAQNFDPSTGWTGSVFCTLFAGEHEEDGRHIGFTPAGNVRKWTDIQSRIVDVYTGYRYAAGFWRLPELPEAEHDDYSRPEAWGEHPE